MNMSNTTYFEPKLTALAVEVAALVRADDGDTAGTSLALVAMEIALALLRGEMSDADYATLYAHFGAAMAAQRMSSARTTKVMMALDIAVMTFRQVTLGTVVVA